jgi:hypothetical protein
MQWRKVMVGKNEKNSQKGKSKKIIMKEENN